MKATAFGSNGTFNRFFNQQGPILKTKYPFLTQSQIKCKAHDLWKKLPKDDQKQYESTPLKQIKKTPTKISKKKISANPKLSPDSPLDKFGAGKSPKSKLNQFKDGGKHYGEAMRRSIHKTPKIIHEQAESQTSIIKGSTPGRKQGQVRFISSKKSDKISSKKSDKISSKKSDKKSKKDNSRPNSTCTVVNDKTESEGDEINFISPSEQSSQNSDLPCYGGSDESDEEKECQLALLYSDTPRRNYTRSCVTPKSQPKKAKNSTPGKQKSKNRKRKDPVVQIENSDACVVESPKTPVTDETPNPVTVTPKSQPKKAKKSTPGKQKSKNRKRKDPVVQIENSDACVVVKTPKTPVTDESCVFKISYGGGDGKMRTIDSYFKKKTLEEGQGDNEDKCKTPKSETRILNDFDSIHLSPFSTNEDIGDNDSDHDKDMQLAQLYTEKDEYDIDHDKDMQLAQLDTKKVKKFIKRGRKQTKKDQQQISSQSKDKMSRRPFGSPLSKLYQAKMKNDPCHDPAGDDCFGFQNDEDEEIVCIVPLKQCDHEDILMNQEAQCLNDKNVDGNLIKQNETEYSNDNISMTQISESIDDAEILEESQENSQSSNLKLKKQEPEIIEERQENSRPSKRKKQIIKLEQASEKRITRNSTSKCTAECQDGKRNKNSREQEKSVITKDDTKVCDSSVFKTPTLGGIPNIPDNSRKRAAKMKQTIGSNASTTREKITLNTPLMSDNLVIETFKEASKAPRKKRKSEQAVSSSDDPHVHSTVDSENVEAHTKSNHKCARKSLDQVVLDEGLVTSSSDIFTPKTKKSSKDQFLSPPLKQKKIISKKINDKKSKNVRNVKKDQRYSLHTTEKNDIDKEKALDKMMDIISSQSSNCDERLDTPSSDKSLKADDPALWTPGLLGAAAAIKMAATYRDLDTYDDIFDNEGASDENEVTVNKKPSGVLENALASLRKITEGGNACTSPSDGLGSALSSQFSPALSGVSQLSEGSILQEKFEENPIQKKENSVKKNVKIVQRSQTRFRKANKNVMNEAPHGSSQNCRIMDMFDDPMPTTRYIPNRIMNSDQEQSTDENNNSVENTQCDIFL